MAESGDGAELNSNAARGPSRAASGKGWLPPEPEELQRLLPQYEITALLGRGGMGAVYRGTQINLDRPVAIKILPPGLDEGNEEANYAERFKNEARAMARLSHPAIVAVYDSGETADGLLYIVMEFVEGTDVQQMVARQGRLHSEHAMAVIAHVCDALHYAHERGIVHRDIKPANIMVGYNGMVKVADFGLAKMSRAGETALTRSGVAMGTLHYMAPEALMLGTSVDHRADVYAVGVMLYFMLTGRLPQGMFELPSLQVSGLDPRFDGIIATALRDDRELRYQTAAALRHDLDAIRTQAVPQAEVPPDGRSQPALPSGARPQPQPHSQGQRSVSELAPTRVERRPPARSTWPAWAAAAVLAICGGAGALLWSKLGSRSDANAHANASGSEAKPGAASPAPGDPGPTMDEAPAAMAKLAPAEAVPTAGAGGSLSVSGAPPPELAVTPGLAAGVWHDLLTPDGLENFNLLQKEPGSAAGYRASSSLHGISTAVFKDCVVRARFSGQWSMPPSLRTRINGSHRISTAQFGYKAQLNFHLPGSYKPFAGNASSMQPLRDQAFDLELQAVGDRYTVRINGEMVVEGTMPGYPSGHVGFFVDAGTVIEAFEVMPMGAGQPRAAGAAASAAPSASRPVRTPGAMPMPAAGAAPVAAVLASASSAPKPRARSGSSSSAGAELAGVILRHTFGSLTEPGMDVAGASVEEGELLLDGQFAPAKTTAQKGYRAVFECPDFDETKFTLAVKLQHERGQDLLLAGGTSQRWLTVKAVPGGTLEIGFKNEALLTKLYGTGVPLGKPFVLVVTGNVKEGPITLYVDGQPLKPVEVPRELANTAGTDRRLSFTNYGTYETLKGKVDELVVYNRILTAPEVAALKLGEEPAGPGAEKAAGPPLWTDRKGRQMQAAFVRLDHDTVVLLINGREVPVPLATLGDESVRQARALAVAAEGVAAAPGLPAVTNSLGMKFVPVPGLTVLFCVHETRYRDYAAYAATVTGQDVKWKDQTYGNFSLAGPAEDHPVTQVQLIQAQRFCDWLGQQEARTYRLPTNDEWSVAAGMTPDSRGDKPARSAVRSPREEFPWGGAVWPPPANAGNYCDEAFHRSIHPKEAYLAGYDDGFPTTAPVMSFPANAAALHDMGGNVWEWVTLEGQPGRPGKTYGSRGGSFLHSERAFLVTRKLLENAMAGADMGFRLVLVP